MMTDFHRQQIHICYKDIIDNMAVENVLDHRSLSLTQWELENILHLKGKAKKAGALLDIILQKPDPAFDTLVEALQSTEQGHLADLLLGERESSHTIIYSAWHIICCMSQTKYVIWVFEKSVTVTVGLVNLRGMYCERGG